MTKQKRWSIFWRWKHTGCSNAGRMIAGVDGSDEIKVIDIARRIKYGSLFDGVLE